MSRYTQMFEDMWTPLMSVHPIPAWHASCIPPATLVHCDPAAQCLSMATRVAAVPAGCALRVVRRPPFPNVFVVLKLWPIL